MRLKLLPEMFESVKEVRALYRASGTKSNLNNADVVDLYSKINGNNRKLVNYMLKIRDNNGNRLFSVCDIVELINKSNSILKAKKQSNPNMKAADVKAYYNHIFDYYVSKYGKVKHVRKNVSPRSSIKQMKLRKAS